MIADAERREAAGAAGGAEPKAAKPRNDGEHDHQVAFFRILELNERKHPELRFIFAVPNAGKRTRRERGRLIAEGLKAGVPDICIPIGRKGHFGAFIENKFGGNKMTPEQREFSLHLTQNNYAFKTCYTVDEQLAFVEWYLGIQLTK